LVAMHARRFLTFYRFLNQAYEFYNINIHGQRFGARKMDGCFSGPFQFQKCDVVDDDERVPVL
jgi:hypothetical protein